MGTAAGEAEAGAGGSACSRVMFASVPVGGMFKERADGCWMLKTSRGTGLYKGSGVCGEPRFSAQEEVLAELHEGQETTQGQGA
jgi:hypothetical protein